MEGGPSRRRPGGGKPVRWITIATGHFDGQATSVNDNKIP